MARHNFREIVLMILAVLGGLGILLLISSRLIHVMASPIPPGNGGVVFVVGGVSVKLFALIVTVVAIVVVLAVFLSRR
jgi:hypothetical protein